MLLGFFTIVSFLITLVLLPFITKMIKKAGFVRPNFKDEHIPLGVGLVFFITLILTGIVGLLIDSALKLNLLILMFVTTSMTLLGIIDDLLGSAEAKGLKGHFKKLFLEKELTTGALKALMGGFVALSASLAIFSFEWNLSVIGKVILATLIIALNTNLMNLLDLRPGRAGKGFLVFAIILIVLGYNAKDLPLLGLVLGSLLAYLPMDLAAKAMMGDTGSNVLGATLGFIGVLVLSMPYQIGLFILLVVIHIITERYSLTKIIESNKVLKYFDMLGRE